MGVCVDLGGKNRFWRMCSLVQGGGVGSGVTVGSPPVDGVIGDGYVHNIHAADGQVVQFDNTDQVVTWRDPGQRTAGINCI